MKTPEASAAVVAGSASRKLTGADPNVPDSVVGFQPDGVGFLDGLFGAGYRRVRGT